MRSSTTGDHRWLRSAAKRRVSKPAPLPVAGQPPGPIGPSVLEESAYRDRGDVTLCRSQPVEVEPDVDQRRAAHLCNLVAGDPAGVDDLRICCRQLERGDDLDLVEDADVVVFWTRP